MVIPRTFQKWWTPRRPGREDAGPAAVFDELDRLHERALAWIETARVAGDLAVPTLADWCVITLERSDDPERRRVVAHPSADSRLVLERALRRDPLDLNRPHQLNALTTEVLANGRPRTLRPGRDWSLRFYGANPSERYALESLTPGWVAAYPLLSRGTIVGVVTFALVSPRSSRRELQELQARFAARTGLILDHVGQIEQLERARHEMRHVEQQVYSVLDRDFSAVATLASDWCVTYLNAAAEELLHLRRDRDTGRSVLEVLPPKAMSSPLWDVCLSALSRNEAGTARFVESWTGDHRWVEVRAHPLSGGGGALYVRDITHEKEREARLKQHEEELREAQKLESIGRLAGGVAHDFNNILMAINGHTELALRRIAEGRPGRDSLEEVRLSAQRGAHLIRQLLAYSRKGKQQRRPVDLAAIVAALEASLLRLVGEDVELTVRSGREVPHVLADPNQLEQVVLNLAVNARDAMPSGGQLRIDIERRSAIEHDVDVPAETPPDGWVLFSVTDTGLGIPSHVLPHIFEPFYTTKSDRTGTGLGLSTVHGIVRQHGGTIAVESQVGKGSTLHMYLPACSAAAEATVYRPIEAARPADRLAGPPAPAARPTKTAGRPGDEAFTILVAEDEERVLDFICATLRDEGYAVIEARNGAEALAVMKRHGSAIDLLLTDVVMPYMGGRELSARLTELDRNLRVVYMSGYAENVINQDGDVPPGVLLLEKPFSSSHLLEVIRDVLAGEVTAAPYVG
jgi:two-component system cell cycle sensor histidine kinase/response regulator CckA